MKGDLVYQVLIVDDDKLARKGLISIVPWTECGLAVAGDVSNGVIALDFIKHHSIDVVVVDLSMPVLSGLDFIRESQKRHPHINYIVLSFHEGFEYIQSALRLGALDYISKLRLEQEDCTAVFKRVKTLLDTVRSTKENMPHPLTKNIHLPDKLCEKLESVYWVFHQDLFLQIIDEITRDKLSSKQLDRMVIKTINIIENTFEFKLSEKDYETLQDEIEVMKQIRQDIYELAENATQTATLSLLILKSILYIRQNLTSHHLTTEKIADAVNMSRGYFSINFKRFTGCTVNHYLRKERIILAKAILKQEKIATEELAYRVGYRDEKYFAKIFQEREGVTCSEYRKQMTSNYIQ